MVHSSHRSESHTKFPSFPRCDSHSPSLTSLRSRCRKNQVNSVQTHREPRIRIASRNGKQSSVLMPCFAARRFQSIDTVYASPSSSGGVEIRPDSSKCHPNNIHSRSAHSLPSATVGASSHGVGAYGYRSWSVAVAFLNRWESESARPSSFSSAEGRTLPSCSGESPSARAIPQSRNR